MRHLHIPSFLIASLALPLVLALGATTPARGALCGDLTGPCSCGDLVVDNPTTLDASDPVTLAPCPCTVGRNTALAVDTGVTLNLGFRTIQSGLTSEGLPTCDIGIFLAGDNIVVQSGKITGFLAGVFGATTGSTLAGLQVYANDIGILLIASNTTVRNSVVKQNGDDCIAVIGGGNTVNANRCEDNDGRGLVVVGAMNSVTANWVLGGDDDGFDINGSQATVSQNRSSYNAGEGFKIAGSGHTVTLNNALENGDTGENGFLVSSTGSRFERNTSNYNDGFGIKDTTIGGGTSMTANTYVNNRCAGNVLGKSMPLGLCQ